MKKFYGVTCAALIASSLLNAQQTQTYSYYAPSGQVVTTTQVDPNNPSQVVVPGAPATVATQPVIVTQPVVPGQQVILQPVNAVQPGYQYQNAPAVQTQPLGVTPQEAAAQNYIYGESSVQYAPQTLPVKPYVPYSQLSPPQNAYPLSPTTTPDVNQVNQQFLQRYSQQDQDLSLIHI